MNKKITILSEYNHAKNLKKCCVCGELISINKLHEGHSEEKKCICEECESNEPFLKKQTILNG